MKNITKNIVLCFLLSCAVKSPPTGGPLDIDSPYIIDISPISGQTGLDEKESIQIYFNEMIDENSIKSSIEISPKIDIMVNSYGKRISIKPRKSWPSQKEIKIKIKRSISDYSGNNMNSSIILTYSTSDKISSGSILK